MLETQLQELQYHIHIFHNSLQKKWVCHLFIVNLNMCDECNTVSTIDIPATPLHNHAILIIFLAWEFVAN